MVTIHVCIMKLITSTVVMCAMTATLVAQSDGSDHVKRRCVQCDSSWDKTPDECLNNPPAPRACPFHNTGTDHYCLVIRDMDKDGNLIQFSRQCSFDLINACDEQPANPPGSGGVICYSGCDTDGCNSGSTAGAQVSPNLSRSSALVLVCITMVMCIQHILITWNV